MNLKFTVFCLPYHALATLLITYISMPADLNQVEMTVDMFSDSKTCMEGGSCAKDSVFLGPTTGRFLDQLTEVSFEFLGPKLSPTDLLSRFFLE